MVYAIVSCAPEVFRNGHPVSLRTWRDLTGFRSHAHSRAGLLELQRWGLVVAVPYGAKCRYAGAPLLWHPQVIALSD